MKKIIWAIDPYQSKDHELVRDAHELTAWFGKDDVNRIKPVFVLTSGVRLLPFGTFRKLLPELKKEAQKKLDHSQKLLASVQMSKPKLLIHPSEHVENIASTLLNYAKQEEVDLIALRTRGKRGLARFFLGSLAETLLKRATVPVLVLNRIEQREKKSRLRRAA